MTSRLGSCRLYCGGAAGVVGGYALAFAFFSVIFTSRKSPVMDHPPLTDRACVALVFRLSFPAASVCGTESKGDCRKYPDIMTLVVECVGGCGFCAAASDIRFGKSSRCGSEL
jgi:hypothetical protein